MIAVCKSSNDSTTRSCWVTYHNAIVQNPVTQSPSHGWPLAAETVHRFDHKRAILMFALVYFGEESTELALGDMLARKSGETLINQNLDQLQIMSSAVTFDVCALTLDAVAFGLIVSAESDVPNRPFFFLLFHLVLPHDSQWRWRTSCPGSITVLA
jgi:hypothetical protein